MSTYDTGSNSYDADSSATSTSTYDDDRRANPMGAYITTLGALITLIAVWLPWLSLGNNDEGNNAISGYESDGIIPFVGFLGIALSLALLYALSRADRRQHRGLSLASMAVGLAWLLYTIAFFIDPIGTQQYEDRNISSEYGVFVSLLGALIWTLGSFLLAKEPEGDDDYGRTVGTERYTQPVTTTGHTSTVRGASSTTVGETHTTGIRDDNDTTRFGDDTTRFGDDTTRFGDDTGSFGDDTRRGGATSTDDYGRGEQSGNTNL